MPRSPKPDVGSDPSDRSWEALQAQAIAILQQEPQMEQLRFVRRLGLPTKRRQNRSGGITLVLTSQARRTIAALEQAGIIQLQAPTAVRESVLVCRLGYVPRQPSKGYQTLCTTSFDPHLKGAWQPGDQPVRSPITDLSLTPKPLTPTEANMTRTRENLERALAAVAAAEEAAIAAGTDKLPSRNAIGLDLGLEDYFYNGTQGGRQATAAYNAAQTRLNLKRAEVESQSSSLTPHPSPLTLPPTPDPYQQRLEEDNERLRGEIEALRQQMQQVPPVSRETTLLQALKDEDGRLRGEADALLRQIDTLQRQHERLLTEANAIQRLIEQREGAIEQAETAVAATNGHKVLAEVAR